METIQAFQTFASPTLDAMVYWLTNLGSEQAYIVLMLIVFVGISPKIGQRLGITLLMSFYINQQAKAFFDTARPFTLDPSLARSEEAIQTALGPGFPSGHAQAGATFWSLAALYIQKTWFWIVAILLIAALGLSRIYLGVHLPIDVWAGFIMGAVIALIGFWAFPYLSDLKATPKTLSVIITLLISYGLHFIFPTADSGTILGATAAFIIGPVVIKHKLSPSVTKRIILTLIALVLAFGVLIASSLLLPESIKRSSLGSYLRYLSIGLVGTLLIPYLGKITGLAQQAD